MRLLASFAAFLFLSTVSVAASAYGNGATGFSGKQAGQTCNSCHTGGTAPTVTITGPATLAPGAVGDYTMVVTTAAVAAGANIATSAGTLASGTGLKLMGDELTHTAGAPAIGGSATFAFKLTAPASGSIKLFAAGLAGNGVGSDGDTALQITKDITVTAGATPGTPAPGDDPATPADNAADPSADEVTTDTDGTIPSSSKKKKKTGDEDDDEDDGNQRERTPMANVGMNCSTTHGASSDAGFATAAMFLFGLGLVFKRRTRRES